MKNKKRVILIAVLVLAFAAVGYVGYRLAIRGTDIIGVTTLPDRNTVYVNGKSGDEFTAGSGFITVGEGEQLCLKYDFSAGGIDIYFRADENAADAYENVTDFDPEKLPTAEEMTGEGAFGQAGVTGKGTLDFPAEAGTYTVFFVNHGVIGKASVTAKKG